MTGPEHYRHAESCLDSVDDDSERSMALMAEAQVHATLALAAATALGADLPLDDSDAWTEAASKYAKPVTG